MELLVQAQWDNPDAEEYINELGGSKSGVHAYLDDAAPHLRDNLPGKWFYWEPGDDIETFLDRINDFSRVKIVRFCHRHDMGGMVDLIPSPKAVGRNEVRAAIEEITKLVEYQDFLKYYKYETGEEFDGKFGILVQDYYKGKRGSIIAHPHYPEVYRVLFGEHEAIVDEEGRGIRAEHLIANPCVLDIQYQQWRHHETAKRAVKLYKEVCETGVIPSTNSGQMEFVEDDDLICLQMKLFKALEPYKDFNPLESAKNHCDPEWGKISMPNFQTFGILPEEGIEIIATKLNQPSIAQCSAYSNVGYANGHYKKRQGDLTSSEPPHLFPRNMTAYFPDEVEVMLHQHFRWLQKAQISMIGAGNIIKNRIDKDPKKQPKIKIFSNGIFGVYAAKF